MSDATPWGTGAAKKPALRDSARRQDAGGASNPKPPAAGDDASGVGKGVASLRTSPVEEATLAAMALPWVGQVVRCETLDDRSGIMIVVEGSDWLSRATLSWSTVDEVDDRMEFIVGRRGLSQRESERDFLLRRERVRVRGQSK